MCAVIGKSAQFPLHTWLPDAMAGPTPVSALIHAATMVVAGVYLVARTYGVFWSAFSIGPGTHAHHGVNILAVVGGVTIIIAALLAFVQDDIKKVLAYSTVSQLGYMVMALACGAWVGGIFHLFTHAFFKACLFLGAGSVSHSGSHHSFDMKKDMGGLRKHMPTTFTTFVIASAALAGHLPAGRVLVQGRDPALRRPQRLRAVHGRRRGRGAMLTAAYMTRCMYLTFFGEYRGHGHPHESPKLITVPLVILAVLSVSRRLAQRLRRSTTSPTGPATRSSSPPSVRDYPFSLPWPAPPSASPSSPPPFAGYFYVREEFGFKGLTERSKLAKAGHEFLLNKYYLDHLYTDVIVGAIRGRSPRGRTGSTRTSSTPSSTGWRTTPAGRPDSSTTASTRPWSTVRSTASVPAPRRAASRSAHAPERARPVLRRGPVRRRRPARGSAWCSSPERVNGTIHERLRPLGAHRGGVRPRRRRRDPDADPVAGRDDDQERSPCSPRSSRSGFGVYVFAHFNYDHTGDPADSWSTATGSTSSTPGTTWASTGSRCR